MKYLKRFSLEVMIVLVSAFVVLLSSCEDESVNGKSNYSRVGGVVGENVFTDPETGCQYFTSSHYMQPRLGTDGFPLCGNSIPIGDEK